MIRRTLITLVLTAVAALMVFAQPAFALPTSTAVYNPSTESIDVAIEGGEVDSVYTIHVLPQEGSCVDTAVGSGTIHLTGPDDAGTAALECITPDGSAEVAVQFCIGPPGEELCFETITLILGCRSDCSILEIGRVPALSTWGIAVLLFMIVATGVWVLRRKRATAR